MADHPPLWTRPSASTLSVLKTKFKHRQAQTQLALMHAMQVFEQNGTIEPSSKDTTTPLDGMAIYPINSVISHPLITLWPAKIEKPYYTPLPWAIPWTSSPSVFMTSMYAHFLLDRPILISYQVIVSPFMLSLITKTQIRGLDDFNLSKFVSCVLAFTFKFQIRRSLTK
jgi:hypothetical protein